MMDKLNKFMKTLKKQNPNANWANLLTGVAVLMMVAVFSYAYFTRSKGNNVAVDLNSALEEAAVNTGGSPLVVEQTPTTSEVTPETPVGETTTVQKGEGLWQVAQRVCGDGEKYNILANANGLSVWEGLVDGMTLKVVCK